MVVGKFEKHGCLGAFDSVEGCWRFLDSVETCEVRSLQVFKPRLQDVQIINFGGVGTCDSAFVQSLAPGEFFGGTCCIECRNCLDLRIFCKEPGTLGKCLRVTVDPLEVGKLNARHDAQGVLNAQHDFAHDAVTPLVKQVVVCLDGSCGRILDGDSSAVSFAGFYRLVDFLESVHRECFDIFAEQIMCGTVAVGTLAALECNLFHK